MSTAPAVPLTVASEVGRARVALTDIRAVTLRAVFPGDTSGPAVRVDVSISNTSSTPLDPSNTVVTLTGTSGDPAAPFSGPPAAPFTKAIASGGRASATYVFTLAVTDRARSVVSVSLDAGLPVATFRGALPR